MKKMNDEDTLAKGLSKEIEKAILEWVGQRWTDTYTLGRIDSILGAAESLKFEKKDLVVKLSFSNLMKEMDNFKKQVDKEEPTCEDEED